jgi:hypothetical protein
MWASYAPSSNLLYHHSQSSELRRSVTLHVTSGYVQAASGCSESALECWDQLWLVLNSSATLSVGGRATEVTLRTYRTIASGNCSGLCNEQRVRVLRLSFLLLSGNLHITPKVRYSLAFLLIKLKYVALSCNFFLIKTRFICNL